MVQNPEIETLRSICSRFRAELRWLKTEPSRLRPRLRAELGEPGAAAAAAAAAAAVSGAEPAEPSTSYGSSFFSGESHGKNGELMGKLMEIDGILRDFEVRWSSNLGKFSQRRIRAGNIVGKCPLPCLISGGHHGFLEQLWNASEIGEFPEKVLLKGWFLAVSSMICIHIIYINLSSMDVHDCRWLSVDFRMIWGRLMVEWCRFLTCAPLTAVQFPIRRQTTWKTRCVVWFPQDGAQFCLLVY